MARLNTNPNDQQNQPDQQLMRGSQPQQRSLSRPGNYGTFGITPGDFFRMGPLSLMRHMNEEMARFFGDVPGNGGQSSQMTWMPAIDVQQRDGRMVVSAELPGMQPGDVNIEVADDALVIQGERRDDRDQDRGGFHVTERRYGRFYRAVPLPEGAKTDAVSARFNNGILEIDVPVDQQRQSSRRQIPIQSGSTQNPGVSSSQSPPNRVS